MNRDQRKIVSGWVDELNRMMAELEDVQATLEEDDCDEDIVYGGCRVNAESLIGIISDIGDMREEEENKLENMPENMRDSSKGDTLEEILGYFDDAMQSLQDARDSLVGDAMLADRIENALSELEAGMEHLDSVISM